MHSRAASGVCKRASSPASSPGCSQMPGPRNVRTTATIKSRRQDVARQHLVAQAAPPEGAAATAPAPATRTSLIPETLEGMEQDTELQQYLQQLAKSGQQALTREERLKRQRSLDKLGVPSFYAVCKERGVSPLVRSPATIFQLNIGLYCNQACSHCHVESSPLRTREQASREVVDRCLQLLAAAPHVTTLDITGGAPELNANFRYLVERAAALRTGGRTLDIIDRCNLTVLLEPGQEDLPAFLAQHQVRVVASLPCYSESNVDAQRGRGVFERSLEGLRLLNAAGYGVEGSGLTLDLVYNPGGAFLCPPQSKLQEAYKSELGSAYGITFSRLLALNNMPIKRFADWLARAGKMEEYMQLLVGAFNPAAGESLMCRDTLSVRWDGALFDCDFNQQLDMAMVARGAQRQGQGQQGQGEQQGGPAQGGGSGRPLTVFDLQSLSELTGRPIACDNHCYGCTAGSGSSCQGAVA